MNAAAVGLRPSPKVQKQRISSSKRTSQSYVISAIGTFRRSVADQEIVEARTYRMLQGWSTPLLALWVSPMVEDEGTRSTMGEFTISRSIHAKPLTKKISRRASRMRTWPIAEGCSPSAWNGKVDCWMVYHRGRRERVERKR